jgi:hypothetical protein
LSEAASSAGCQVADFAEERRRGYMSKIEAARSLSTRLELFCSHTAGRAGSRKDRVKHCGNRTALRRLVEDGWNCAIKTADVRRRRLQVAPTVFENPSEVVHIGHAIYQNDNALDRHRIEHLANPSSARNSSIFPTTRISHSPTRAWAIPLHSEQLPTRQGTNTA